MNIQKIPVNATVTEEDIARLVVSGWVYIGVFNLGGAIVTPDNPGGVPSHVWVLPPGAVSVPNIIGVIMGVADELGDSEPLDKALQRLVGMTINEVRSRVQEMEQERAAVELMARGKVN